MQRSEARIVLDGLVERELGAKRGRHSRSVAELAAILCASHGLDSELGYIAGLAHDLCKPLPLAGQRALALRAEAILGREFRYSAAVRDDVLHGPAMAARLHDEIGFGEESVLEAVALHSVGAPDMGLLSKIVYAADKLEPGRLHVSPEFRERCLGLEADELLLAVIEDSLVWLESRDREVAPETRELLAALRLRQGVA